MKKFNAGYYKIPKKIKIGGFNYEVIFPYTFKETESYMGLHCTEDLQIFLTPFIHGNNVFTSRAKMHECFLHEIIHGIDAVYLSDDMEHREVYMLAQTFHQVLHDNILNIKAINKPLPKKIKIGGVDYNVFIHDFKEIDSNCSVNEETCSLAISDCITNLQYQRSLLVFGITAIIYARLKLFDSEISVRSCSNDRDFRIFSRGLYQVIVDNDLERIMKNG